jgi:hypothetical protein
VRQRDQPPDELRPASGHPHVGQDQGRAVLAGDGHRIVAVGHPPDHAEVRLLVQQLGQGRCDAVVVVRDDDGDLTAGPGRHRTTVPHDASAVVMRAHRGPGTGALVLPSPGRPVRARLGS